MSDCEFVVWPEENVPDDCLDCTVCELYKHGSRMIWGEGNPSAKLFILLDNPGAREDRYHSPFVCGTRQTLQEAIDKVGLMMSDVYVTYVLKRRPIRSYDKDTTREICFRQHAWVQLQQKRPELVVCLGNVAVQTFFQDSLCDVKQVRQSWHMHNGYRVTAAYHPLAVRRRPNLLHSFLDDWSFIAKEYKCVRSNI